MKYLFVSIALILGSIYSQAQQLKTQSDTMNITKKHNKKIEWKDSFFVVYSKNTVRKLGRIVSLGDSGMAIGLWPFIFIRPDLRNQPVYAELVRHETIHLRQQRELLIVGAWLLYGIEYLYARKIKKLDRRQAYYFTAMEQEAHRNAMREDYLEKRKSFAVLKYIKDKKWLGRDANGQLITRDY